MLTREAVQSLFTLRYNLYSKPFYDAKNPKDFQSHEEPSIGWVNETRELLETSIYNELESYDNIGVSLSGGIDSTLMLGLIRKIFPKKNIHCIHDTCSNETKFAENIAKKYDCQFTSVHRYSIIPEIPDYVSIAQEPRWNVYHGKMAQLAKSLHLDCLVTGDGGDELFAGYTHRYKAFLESGVYLDGHKNDWVDDQDFLFKEPGIMDKFKTTTECRDLNEVFTWDYDGKLLRDLLPVSQKISEYYDIPIIAPIMELRDFAPHIPISQKYDGTNGKLPLRQICKELGIPIQDKKIGYSYDIISDWKYNQEEYNKLMISIPDSTWDYINPEWLVTHKADGNTTRIISKYLQILALGEYLKEE